MILRLNSPKAGEREVLIDEEDWDRIKDYNWGLAYRTKNNECYVRVQIMEHGKSITIYLHRLIMNCPKDKLVDHINHNTLDNRKCNLRICTKKENAMNSKITKRSTTGYKGVTWDKVNKKYRAKISIKDNNSRKTLCLGRYLYIEDAAKAYNEAAIKYFGEFANLNIIGEETHESRITCN